jgi:AcrR family transcriptional regulator
MSEARHKSRDNILDAAQRVAGKVGAGNLTLDKVACECGMSKGGLLYNFPNKDALLAAMLDRLLEQHQQILATEERMLGDEPNRCLKAILRSMACHQMADPEVYLSLLAAASQQPELLTPVREALASHYQRLTNESTDPQLAVLLWLAAEGLMFHDILNIAPYSKSEKNNLFQRLFEISGEVS